MSTQYTDIREVLNRYWRIYGGLPALRRSPYLHISIVLTLIMYTTWSSAEWWSIVISVIPSLVGFTLGGYAIIVTLGNDDFKEFIYSVDEGEEASFILDVGTTFVHFIMLQVVSLLFALIAKSLYVDISPLLMDACNRINVDVLTLNAYIRSLFWFVGVFVFIYAIVTTIAAAMAIFRLNWLYQQYVNTKGSIIDLKQCQHCAEVIKLEARVCRYCGREIKNDPAQL